MNFDNVYKAGKAFLFFSIGIFVLTLSVSLWRDGKSGCHKVKWHGKYGHDCSKGNDIGVEVFAFDDEDIDISKLDDLLKDEELKSLLKEGSGLSRSFDKEIVDTLDDGTVIIKKFKTVIVDE